jgi:hypothetical protein
MASPFFPEVIAAWKATPFIDGTEIPAKEFLDAAQMFLPIFGTTLGTNFSAQPNANRRQLANG